MAYQLHELCDETRTTTLTPQALRDRIDDLVNVHVPRLERLWRYYTNPMRLAAQTSSASRPYRQAQEWGLPLRLVGDNSSDGAERKEIVIENDIAWRIDTMVDYLFGKPLVLNAAAPDPARRATIETLLRLILAHNGGVTFLQHAALLGSVYGFVDVLVKLVDEPSCDTPACGTQMLGQPPVAQEQESPTDANPHAGSAADHDALARIASRIRLEIVEPLRALPLLSDDDFRDVQTYAQVYWLARHPRDEQEHADGNGAWLRRLFPNLSRRVFSDTDKTLVVELISPTRWQRYENERLVAEGENSLGQIPLVHVQNTAIPFRYAGASDVEVLVPLQDELNTRLSDRAHRITMQSFKMYLGKGIDNFNDLPIAPGRMWTTDNDNADIIEFGGDAGANASEDNHIRELREALDKTSGVTPIAAGAVEGRIGNLTSAAALRVTLQALIAKTERKRSTYGLAIERICELSLAWLDRAGLFPNAPAERHVELNWPSPIPESAQERLEEAEAKLRLGVAKDVVLRELGY